MRESPETEKTRLPKDTYAEWLKLQVKKYSKAEHASDETSEQAGTEEHAEKRRKTSSRT